MRVSRQWFVNTAGDSLRLIRWVPRKQELHLRFHTPAGLSSPLQSRSFLMEVAKDLIVTQPFVKEAIVWRVEKPLRVERNGNFTILVLATQESKLTSRIHEGVISKRLDETQFGWPSAEEKPAEQGGEAK